jgi:plastocyanin
MRRLIASASMLVVGLAVAACSPGGASPAASAAQDSNDPSAPVVQAKDLAFTTTSVTVTAGKQVSLVFDNEDSAPHNIAVAPDAGFSNILFKSDIITGPQTRTYTLPALAAGTYHFRCDVHPNMTGTIVAK